MKAKSIILSSLIVVLVTLLAVNFFPEEKPEALNKQIEDQQYRVYKYKITEVTGDDYHGVSIEGSGGIHFTSSKIPDTSNIKIQEGDLIRAYFDLDNTIQGLVKVEKMAKGEES
ncbi:hypothetical protein GJU40_01170 [Bacillus lacus]|uniref:Uncharacterized protein n=1 Tax=Metabacillus lacus TaxID=1983721 RepID=A0A7X2LYC6_9BACI|nr:hypothetical protein [Metabacillus lacus]MRX70777.1 hypothetical protein [Metabacillus lacus]